MSEWINIFWVVWLILFILIFKMLYKLKLKLSNLNGHSILNASSIRGKKLSDYIPFDKEMDGKGGLAVILSPRCPPCHQILEELSEESTREISIYIKQTSPEEVDKLTNKYKNTIEFNKVEPSNLEILGLKFTPAFLFFNENGEVTNVSVSME